MTSLQPVFADLAVLPGVPAWIAARRRLRASAVPAERDVEDHVLVPGGRSDVLDDVADAGPLVEVHGGRIGHGIPVVDLADRVPVPAGRLRIVPVEAEVAVEQNLVRLERRRRQVVADPAG